MLGSALALTLSSPAKAQEWLRDSRVGEGAGLHAGEFDVHAGLAAEVGYDSNYLLRSDKTGPSDSAAQGYLSNGAPGAPPIATGELRITPSISIRTSPGAMRSDGRGGAPFALSLGAIGSVPRVFHLGAAEPAEHVRERRGGHRDSSRSRVERLCQRDLRTLDSADGPGRSRRFVQQRRGLRDCRSRGSAQPRYPRLALRIPDHGHRLRAELGTAVQQPPPDRIHARQVALSPSHCPHLRRQISYRNFSNTTNAAFTLHSSTPVRARIGLEGLVTPRLLGPGNDRIRRDLDRPELPRRPDDSAVRLHHRQRRAALLPRWTTGLERSSEAVPAGLDDLDRVHARFPGELPGRLLRRSIEDI